MYLALFAYIHSKVIKVRVVKISQKRELLGDTSMIYKITAPKYARLIHLFLLEKNFEVEIC